MTAGFSVDSRLVESVSELVVGDGLYAESSDSAYWVTEITPKQISLESIDDAPCTWQRDTLNASFESNSWVRQSRVALERTDSK
ncbi:hypothetical protein OB955_10680 [Halobacteria archaeon AArc-m2/3/4]|uniref:Uncharacterized protein n=1 Tax=Natronoglomus mannanivorans TaxID=2979990 RepID=A0AAP2YZD7_9EURY|nr:hypothetical protein [Halobacteria archaeon AArc-xg1-1]MCU4973207.1 hypothetical protein [Halobacteria archaeon AArc-m2/3/4]